MFWIRISEFWHLAFTVHVSCVMKSFERVFIDCIFLFQRHFQKFAESGDAGCGPQRTGAACAHLFLRSGSSGHDERVAQRHQRLSARNIRSQLGAACRQPALEPHPQTQHQLAARNAPPPPSLSQRQWNRWCKFSFATSKPAIIQRIDSFTIMLWIVVCV